MEMQDTHKGYWRINKGKTKILVHPGSAHPYKPTSFIYNTDLYIQRNNSSNIFAVLQNNYKI